MIEYSVVIDQFLIFILILIRLASFLYVAPFFNTKGIPGRTKIGLAFFISLIVYSANPNLSIEYNSMLGISIIVLKEVLVGLILGALSLMSVQIIYFAGKVIDMDIGLSMAQLYDPTTRMQTGIMGNFYYYLIMLILVISGLHRYIIGAIVETFKVIPLGGVVFRAKIYDIVLDFMSDYFVIGFRIALPVFAATLLLNCVLAILAKVSPQMNMFVVGMQLKIFVGIFVILVTISMLPSVSNFIQNEIKTILAKLVKSMY